MNSSTLYNSITYFIDLIIFLTGNNLFGISKRGNDLCMLTNNFKTLRTIENPFGVPNTFFLFRFFSRPKSDSVNRTSDQRLKWKPLWDTSQNRTNNDYASQFPIFTGTATGLTWLFMEAPDIIHVGHAACNEAKCVADSKNEYLQANWWNVSSDSSTLYDWLQSIAPGTRISSPQVQINIQCPDKHVNKL